MCKLRFIKVSSVSLYGQWFSSILRAKQVAVKFVTYSGIAYGNICILF